MYEKNFFLYFFFKYSCINAVLYGFGNKEKNNGNVV